jgi:hypothetical protein
VNNAVVVTYMYYLSLTNQPIEVSSTQSVFPWWTGIIALVALVALFGWLRKSVQQYPPREIFYEPTNPFDQRGDFA